MIPFSSKNVNRYLAKKFFRGLFRYVKAVLWNFVSLVFVWYIFGLNMNNIHIKYFYPPTEAHWLLGAFNHDQVWSMFSPAPPQYSWFYHIEGELDNGTKIELFANEGLFTWEPSPFTFEKPIVWRELKNHRWFKYMENGINSHPKNEQLRLYFGSYVCKEYNALHHGTERLYTFSLHMVTEDTNKWDPFAPRNRRPVQTLWRHLCFERPKNETETATPGGAGTQQEATQSEEYPEEMML